MAQNPPPCPTCGQTLEVVEDYGSYYFAACPWCDLGGKEHTIKEYVRDFTCWSCQTHQQAGEDHRSATPGMGHHCLYCDKDLTEWYQLLERRITGCIIQ